MMRLVCELKMLVLLLENDLLRPPALTKVLEWAGLAHTTETKVVIAALSTCKTVRVLRTLEPSPKRTGGVNPSPTDSYIAQKEQRVQAHSIVSETFQVESRCVSACCCKE